MNPLNCFRSKKKAVRRRPRLTHESLETRNLFATLAVSLSVAEPPALAAAVEIEPLPSAADGGGRSLRAAILAANNDPLPSDVVIQLQPGTYVLDLRDEDGQENGGVTGDLDLTAPVTYTFEGAGTSETIIEQFNNDGSVADRVFHVMPGVTAVFRNLTIRGGRAGDDGTAGAQGRETDALGGGILNEGGVVELENVRLANNEAGNSLFFERGEGAMGGGLASIGGSLITRGETTIESNAARGRGGEDGERQLGAHIGGAGYDARGGGIYLRDAAADLGEGTTVAHNVAEGGFGGRGAGLESPDPSGAGGQGGDALGGGLYIEGARVDLTSVDVESNSAFGGNGGRGGEHMLHGGDGGDGGEAAGGGIYIADGAVTVVGGNITANRVNDVEFGGNGGAGGRSLPPQSARSNTGGNGGRGGLAEGGGIALRSGSLELQRVNASDNFVAGGAGGSGGPASLLGGVGGAGRRAGDAHGGGLVHTGGSLEVSQSTFAENVAIGGRGGNGAVVTSPATNGASGRGGDALGGGIYSNAPFDAVNFTVSSNSVVAGSAGFGTGLHIDGRVAGGGLNLVSRLANLRHATIVENDASDLAAGGGAINLINSLAGSVEGSVNDSTSFIGDALLGPLDDNGGPTRTHLPLNRSPAIDGADNSVASHLDQRGIARPHDGDDDGLAIADLGAVELSPSLLSLDVDANGVADALSDGLIIFRYLSGLRGDELVDRAADPDGERSAPDRIAEYLDGVSGQLDVDANGVAQATTDGLLIARYLFDIRGESLVDGAVDPAGSRVAASEIVALLDGFNPNFANQPGPAAPFDSGVSASFQIVTPTRPSQEVQPGDPVSFDLNYTTNPQDNALTGLGLRIHFDSTRLDFVSLDDVLSPLGSLLTLSTPQADVGDADGDASTDLVVIASWLDSGAGFTGSLPNQLLTANFMAAAGFEGDATTVNFTASSTAVGFGLDATSHSVTVTSPESMADLEVNIDDGSDPVNVGDEITYTVTVTNQGPDVAENVILRDVLPPRVVFVSATAGSESGGVVTANLGDIPSGDSVDVTITLSTLASGVLTNLVEVKSDTTDPNRVNNSTSEDTVVVGNPGVSIALERGQLQIQGTDNDDNVTVRNKTNGDVKVVVKTGGQRHVELFRRDRVHEIIFEGLGGDDVFRNLSNIKSTAFGNAGDDTLIGGSAVDRFFGGIGDDVLKGRKGGDFLIGGSGDDSLLGGSGRDFLAGDAGDDVIRGQRGNDVLRGGAGSDVLKGGKGDDFLVGDVDDRRLRGGAGSDTIIRNPQLRFCSNSAACDPFGQSVVEDQPTAEQVNDQQFDLSGDERVDRADLAIFTRGFLKKVEDQPDIANLDFDGDGYVGFSDLDLLKEAIERQSKRDQISPDEQVEPNIEGIKADLSERFGVAADDLAASEVTSEPVFWPSTALGLPGLGADVIVRGHRVQIRTPDYTFTYHTGSNGEFLFAQMTARGVDGGEDLVVLSRLAPAIEP